VWKGSVPPPLSSWAVQLLKTVSKVPFGQTWTQNYSGTQVVARKDYHTWHYQPDGTLLTNICWPGITLYKPLPTGFATVDDVTNVETATPDPSLAVYDVQPTNWSLVAVSAGAILTISALFALAIKHAGRAAGGSKR
jgi:hypothetical protein